MKFKRYISPILLQFLSTRFLVLAVGSLCFFMFPKRGEIFKRKPISDVVNVAGVWNQFDANWYLKLAKEGYPIRKFNHQVQETWGFMPLYPLLIHFVSPVFGANLFITGIFLSNLSTFLALLLLYKLAQEQFNIGLEAVHMLLISAGSFYLSIVYTEGLFLLLTVSVFYLSYKKRFGWALILAGLATVTRIQGIILFIIPAIELLSNQFKTTYKYVPALLVSAVPMVVLMLYLERTCGEPLAFIKIQHAWGSSALFPLQGFLGILKPDRIAGTVVNLIFWLLTIFIIAKNYKRLPLSYLLFTTAYILLSTSNEVVYGTTRYMLGIVPLFIAAAMSSGYLKKLYISLNLVFLAVTISAFVTGISSFI